jgi:L-seryl-tRNA(Ser) seleniumtransferase
VTSRRASAALRSLPAVDRLLRLTDGSPAQARAARALLARLRARLLDGEQSAPLATLEELAEQVRRAAAEEDRPAYPRAVNATGIFLHTGLGRAPLAEPAAAALLETARGFTLLEVDAASGKRQHRESRLLPDLLALTGAPAATVVNNNAAALLLALAALAAGREVVVPRGELVEIGGGFRLPDIMRLSGAQLVEVGTTNRTYARDVERALGKRTALVLSVHTSNFRVVGFHHRPSRAELVAICRKRRVPLLEDLGSGLLVPPGPEWGAAAKLLADEPVASVALAEGSDLVCFSGDKLLGGPQAGVLAGRADLVAACRRHELFRALRPDRLALAALAGTLRAWRQGGAGVPVRAALSVDPLVHLGRAQQLARRLAERFPAARFTAVATRGEAGSGSLPARPLRSAAVEVQWPGAAESSLAGEALAEALRRGQPPVFARLWRGRLRLDVLALLPGDEDALLAAFDALPAAAP